LPVKVKKRKTTRAVRSKRNTAKSRKPRNTIAARNTLKSRKQKKTSSKKVSRRSKKMAQGSGKVIYASTTTTVIEELPVDTAIEVESQPPQAAEYEESAPPLNIPSPYEESSNDSGLEYKMTETTVTQEI
jgi:hypothetical protein